MVTVTFPTGSNACVRVVLPAYNEAGSLPTLLQRISEIPVQTCTIVVDDGSSDLTAEVARGFTGHMQVTLLRHPRNLGLGAALLTGLRFAAGTSDSSDVVIAMDSDNTHDPALIPDMLRKIAEGNDIIIASRYVPGSQVFGVTLLRQVLSLGASVLMRLAFRIPGVRDYTSGYRAYAAGLLKRSFAAYGDHLIEESGFTCVVELLAKLAPLSRGLAEVPLVLHYDRKEGRSKMKILRTVWRYLKLVSSPPRSWIGKMG